MKKGMHKLILTSLIILASFFASTSFAQIAEDTTDGRFHDDLLIHLVGRWDVTAVVHGQKFTLNLEAEWVMNHQYLHIHFKSGEIVPWLKIPFEQEYFFGYNKMRKGYFVHEVSVLGGNGPYEGFCYAYKTGNEFKLVQKMIDSDKINVQRFIWEPTSKSWQIVSRSLADGKEGEPFIEMKLVVARSSTK